MVELRACAAASRSSTRGTRNRRRARASRATTRGRARADNDAGRIVVLAIDARYFSSSCGRKACSCPLCSWASRAPTTPPISSENTRSSLFGKKKNIKKRRLTSRRVRYFRIRESYHFWLLRKTSRDPVIQGWICSLAVRGTVFRSKDLGN